MAALSRSSGALIVAWLLSTSRVEAQEGDVGHKLLGTLGLQAGTQPDPGLYVVSRLAGYSANELMDRNGNPLPVGLSLKALAGGLGVVATFEVPSLSTYVGGAVGISAAHVTGHTERPPADRGRGGIGDLSVQPVRLGWRMPHVDVVAGYAFYAPTGGYTPRRNGGVGRGEWTHELFLGGTLYFDRSKSWYLSALASVEVNSQKRGIDITRGSTIQAQGGLGTTIARFFDVGAVGFALWQITDNAGSDLPPMLQGARDRTFGAGPEIDVTVAPIRSRIILRYEHDFASESRPSGQILLIGLTAAAWAPPRP
jgi:hypothetical protein